MTGLVFKLLRFGLLCLWFGCCLDLVVDALRLC